MKISGRGRRRVVREAVGLRPVQQRRDLGLRAEDALDVGLRGLERGEREEVERRAARRLYLLVLLLVGGGGAREDLGVDADADAEARAGEAGRGGAGGVIFKMGIGARARVRGLAGAGPARDRFRDAAVGAVVARARLGRAADDASRS